MKKIKMKMNINRKTLVVCSLVLLLFIVGYAYNMFTSTNYTSIDYKINPMEETATTDTIETSMTSSIQTPNVAIIEDSKEPQNPEATSTFFTEYRMEREKNRSKERQMWEDIIGNQTTDKTFKTLAQQELVKIVSLTEKEMIIENLIISRGFNDALVFLTDDSVTVIVDAKELTSTNVAQIQDIVVRKTKINAANIKIMKKD